MTKEEIMQLVYYDCRSNNVDFVGGLLSEYKSQIDLLYKEGYAFNIAVGLKSPEILNMLLNFYEEVQIKGMEGNEKDIAYTKLRTVLRNAYEEDCGSHKIEEVLRKYIVLEGDDSYDDEHDLSGFDDVVDITDVSHYIVHKSHSASELMQRSTPIKWLLRGNSTSFLSLLDSSDSDDAHNVSDYLGQESGLLTDL